MRQTLPPILFKYIAKNFIRCFVIVFLCFFLITALLEAMEIVRRFSAYPGLSYGIITKLTVYRTITSISSFFPFTTFLTTLVFFTLFNSKLEITSLKVAGISNIQITRSIMIVILLIGGFYITIFDITSTISADQTKRIEQKITKKPDDEDITITNKGAWFKDKSKNNIYIVYAQSFKNEAEILSNIRFFEFDQEKNFKASIYANSAEIKNNSWIIKNANIVYSDGTEEFVKLKTITTSLSLKSINKMTTNPRNISFWHLSKYADMLEKVGLSGIKYKMHWFFQISSVLQMFALALLATLFSINYNHRNIKRYTTKMAIAVIFAFPIHFLNSLLTAFGNNEIIPIFAATFALPVSTIFITYFMLWRK